VSVFFDREKGGNAAHSLIEDLNIVKKGDEGDSFSKQFALGDLFAEESELHSLMYYKGSLAYPPCTEGVDWFVYHSPLRISDSQVAAI
jgi:carbonic anhydrase